jgi:hypothetical protein
VLRRIVSDLITFALALGMLAAVIWILRLLLSHTPFA